VHNENVDYYSDLIEIRRRHRFNIFTLFRLYMQSRLDALSHEYDQIGESFLFKIEGKVANTSSGSSVVMKG
jgi:hypothetical protein